VYNKISGTEIDFSIYISKIEKLLISSSNLLLELKYVPKIEKSNYVTKHIFVPNLFREIEK